MSDLKFHIFFCLSFLWLRLQYFPPFSSFQFFLFTSACLSLISIVYSNYNPNHSFVAGDVQTTADHNMGRVSPQSQVFQSDYSPFRHTSTGSSPSDSPLVGLSALPGDASQSHNLFDPEFELGYTQQLQGEMLDIHSLRSPTTPPLPEYKPIPPLSPRTILATLDDIANAGPKKKSHARKQPAGHIPRPRNAFILFRCLFVSQQSVPASVEKDHRNISRIAGRVWKAMR